MHNHNQILTNQFKIGLAKKQESSRLCKTSKKYYIMQYFLIWKHETYLHYLYENIWYILEKL